MKIIYETVVGSRSQGLDTPESDFDRRFITLHTLRDVVSPFKNEEVKVENAEGDTESWELRAAAKHLCSGNPTMYEVVRSDLFTPSDFAIRLRDMFPKFRDDRKILMAGCGYVDAQIKLIDKAIYKAIETSDPLPLIENKRVPKCIVAGYRILLQTRQMLETGDFLPRIKDYDIGWHDYLMAIKSMNRNEITEKFLTGHKEEIEGQTKALKQWYDETITEPKVPDINAIEEFLLDTYVRQG